MYGVAAMHGASTTTVLVNAQRLPLHTATEAICELVVRSLVQVFGQTSDASFRVILAIAVDWRLILHGCRVGRTFVLLESSVKGDDDFSGGASTLASCVGSVRCRFICGRCVSPISSCVLLTAGCLFRIRGRCDGELLSSEERGVESASTIDVALRGAAGFDGLIT